MQFTWTELKVIFQNRFKCSSFWFSCQRNISHLSLVITLSLVFLFLPRQLLGGMLTGLKERWQFKSLILWGKLYSIMHYYCSGLGWLQPPTLEVCHLMDCRLTYSFHDFRWELVGGRPLAMSLWTSIFTRKVGRTWPVLMSCYKEGFRRLTQCLILNSQYTIVLIITALVGGKKAHDLLVVISWVWWSGWFSWFRCRCGMCFCGVACLGDSSLWQHFIFAVFIGGRPIRKPDQGRFQAQAI